jgi:hypothetical protein
MDDRAQGAFEHLIIVALLVAFASAFVLVVANLASVKDGLKSSMKSYPENALKVFG